ncbi:hypothetical protein [Paenibacillus sp. FSL R7-0179]|uniref:hypothetical protein n=1 Tax=Paenibacillus sp. FSL R7-0179 TaxID=2921672 RepID=UPI0030F83BCC
MSFIDYPEERKVIIRDYSFDEFKAFFDLIPTGMLANSIKVLPKINGFRTGKDTEIKLKVFLGRIDRWDQKEWRLFSRIWILWAESQESLMNLINHQDIKTTVEKMLSSQSEKIRIMNILVQGEISQSIISQWLKFGPFNIDMDILWLVSLAPSATLKRLEERLETLERQNYDLQQKLFEKQSETIEENLSTLASDFLNIKQAVSLLDKETAKAARKAQQIEHETLTLTSHVNKLSKYESISSDAYKKLVEQIASLNQTSKDLELNYNMLASDQLRLEDHLNQIDMNEIETSIGRIKKLDQTAATAEVYQIYESTIKFESEPIQLISLEQALTHLKNNLNSLGIKLADAKSISFEVLSAVLSNQLVMFSGSMAMFVAEYCAASLCGHTAKIINVPFGKIDDLVSYERIDQWINQAKSYGCPIAIIFEGLNRSSFEVYGASLKKFIAKRIVMLKSEDIPIVFMGTIVTGPSVLNLGKEILEIGPVFNTDHIGWNYKNITPYTTGVIDSSILTRQGIEIIDHLEIEDLLPKGIVEHGSILWRKTIAATYKTMIQLDSSFDFSSVNFGWLIPTTSLYFSDHMEQLFDEIELDERCKALINYMKLEIQ